MVPRVVAPVKEEPKIEKPSIASFFDNNSFGISFDDFDFDFDFAPKKPEVDLKRGYYAGESLNIDSDWIDDLLPESKPKPFFEPSRLRPERLRPEFSSFIDNEQV